MTVGGGAVVNLGTYFSDADGDTLTYAASSSNTGAATVGVSGALVSVTPVAAGTATITATASDGKATTTQVFMVTVNPAVASASSQQSSGPTPVGTIPTQTVASGGGAIVNLGSYFRDADGDTLTYMATSSNTGVTTVSVSGALVSITPVAAGSATVTAMAVDPGGLSATQTFTATVNPPPNSAPVAQGSIPAQTVTVGGSAGSVSMGSYFSDADGDALTYTASASNTGIATVSVSGTVVNITPVAEGAATITVTASDGTATATQTISVTVNPQPNRSPVAVGSIPAQTATVGASPATVSMGGYFSDADGDALTYMATSSDTGVGSVSASGATVTITPIAAGTITVTAIAMDAGGLSAFQTFAVTVNPPPNSCP